MIQQSCKRISMYSVNNIALEKLAVDIPTLFSQNIMQLQNSIALFQRFIGEKKVPGISHMTNKRQIIFRKNE